MDDNTKMVDTADVKAYIKILMMDNMNNDFNLEKYIINKFKKCYYIFLCYKENIIRRFNDRFRTNEQEGTRSDNINKINMIFEDIKCLNVDTINNEILGTISLFFNKIKEFKSCSQSHQEFTPEIDCFVSLQKNISFAEFYLNEFKNTE